MDDGRETYTSRHKGLLLLQGLGQEGNIGVFLIDIKDTTHTGQGY
jgi:hypothetical protein